ncbi:MAG: M20 family metallopeptidase [Gemmataceae bacterium]
MESLPSLQHHLSPKRLLDLAWQLIAIPSPTGDAGKVLDWLEGRLLAEGLPVQRVAGGHPAAPAVVAILDSGKPGPTLQFNGHVDTVHLPFVPPNQDDGRLTGSGASDMKGGTAAALEALFALRDSDLLKTGRVMFTAHDLHEAPWGYGQQLDQMIREGIHGDAVLIPEPLCDHLPVVGRGSATWKIHVSREGPPIHEVMRPANEPSVIAAAARLITRLESFQRELSLRSDPMAGSESVFIGQVHGGEIFNQYPRTTWLEGTRRWLPGVFPREVEREFRQILAEIARETGTLITADYNVIRDAFRLSPEDRLVNAFQKAHTWRAGAALPLGPKLFVDDGNSFHGLGPIAAITHGPRAGGQHTIHEWVDIDDLTRVAGVYAATALFFCTNPG